MLVLSRKPGESIHIGSDIVVTICENAGGRVRIGISCPRDIPIRRSELPVLPLPDAACGGEMPAAKSAKLPSIRMSYPVAQTIAAESLS
jgi:carbon storage regulator CsrA